MPCCLDGSYDGSPDDPLAILRISSVKDFSLFSVHGLFANEELPSDSFTTGVLVHSVALI